MSCPMDYRAGDLIAEPLIEDDPAIPLSHGFCIRVQFYQIVVACVMKAQGHVYPLLQATPTAAVFLSTLWPTSNLLPLVDTTMTHLSEVKPSQLEMNVHRTDQ